MATMTGTKWVYAFEEGGREMRELLGGKGANVAEMTRILGAERVPAGFTITTEACVAYMNADRQEPKGLDQQVSEALSRLEDHAGKELGDTDDPLLVSVRSGARESMPGMMETILNLGLNDESVEGLAKVTKNPRFAYDSYRRFIQMYSTVVVGLPKDVLEGKLHQLKHRLGIQSDTDIPAESLRELCNEFKEFFTQQTGREFPQDPWQQLVGAINAVFGSWMAEKALTYRKVEKIEGLTGTAVNVV